MQTDAPKSHSHCAFVHTRGVPANPDDLLVLLTVARLGRFTAAADVLGVNHTTISRRIALLEKAIGGRVLVQTPGGWELTDLGRDLLGPAEAIERAVAEVGERATGRGQLQGAVRVASPDGYAIHWLVPAVTRLQRDHPQLDLELITATQRAREARSGVDLEVVVGRPAVRRSAAEHLRDYRLQLYATKTYLDRAGTPTALADLGEHTLVYYIESALQVDDLDEAEAATLAIQLEQYPKAIELWESVAAASLGSNLTKYSVKEYYLNAGLCYLAIPDTAAAARAMAFYAQQDPGFPTTAEGQFLHGILQACEHGELDAFDQRVHEFDRMKPITGWRATLLQSVRKSIADEPDLS